VTRRTSPTPLSSSNCKRKRPPEKSRGLNLFRAK
jgi:hypothetical protein